MPGKPTPEELQKIIGSLNSDYGLGISNGSSHIASRSDNEAIYKKIHFLHFQDRNKLSQCLGQFYKEASRLQTRCIPQSFISAGFRPQSQLRDQSLVKLLLNILTDPDPASGIQKQGKRGSNDAQVTQVKRRRSHDGQDPLKMNVVDDLPVRTRCSLSSLRSSESSARSAESILSYMQTSQKPRSMESTRASASTASLSSGTTTPQPSPAVAFSGSTFVNDESDDEFEMSPMCEADFYAAAETFDKKKRRDTGGHPFFARTKSESLKQRLKNVLSMMPIPGLDEAPLVIIWEVTRILRHCNIDIKDYTFTYEPCDRWHNQASFRDLHTTGPFAGKRLPLPSDDQAWNLALHSFQSKTSRVTLSAELVLGKEETGPLFELRLNPLKLDPNHRLIRRFGADRFLEISMPSLPWLEKQFPCFKNFAPTFLRWLVQEESHHYFLGRTWSVFWTKSFKRKAHNESETGFMERLYFFAVNGNAFKKASPESGDTPSLEEAMTPRTRTTFSREGLLNWAISMENSMKQPLTKLFSRIGLCLSRTRPTVTLEPHQIRRRSRPIGSHQDMNDGIGRMSRKLAVQISECLGLTHTSVAFQGRLGCAKGMWVIDVDDDGPDEEVWIETYPSQEKWAWKLEDPLHRCFEVMSWPEEIKSAALNQQFIVILEAQASDKSAMRKAIADHLEKSLSADLLEQAAAVAHPADLRLWLQQSGNSRPDKQSGFFPFMGGLPNSSEVAVAYMLDSGFSPRGLSFMEELIYDIGKKKIDRLKEKASVEIPQSAYMLMVADFSSTLEEGEVHVSFSSKFQVEGFCDTLLEGMDVLVGRSPAHLPSDVQRVRVISHERLRKLKDVIVFSTKGKKPLADLLSGGDYDGDRAWVCWDPNIVNNFHNSPVPDCPDLFKAGFLTKLSRTVEDLTNEQDNAADVCAKFVFISLLFNMGGSLLGQCTKYKEKFCYWKNSVKNQGAIILSNLAGHLVDQSKQGIIFQPDDWTRLRKTLLKAPERLDDPDYSNQLPGKHRDRWGDHILDYLKFKIAYVEADKALKVFKAAVISSESCKDSKLRTYDRDLTKMYGHFEKQRRMPRECCKLVQCVTNFLESTDTQQASQAYDLLQSWRKDKEHESWGLPASELLHVMTEGIISTTWDTILTCLRRDIDAVATEWRTRISARPKEDVNYAKKVKEIHQTWLNIKPPAEVLSMQVVQVLMENWTDEPHTNLWSLLKASTTFKYYHNKIKPQFVWSVAGRYLCLLKYKETKMPGETAGAFLLPEMWAVLRPHNKLIAAGRAQREAGDGNEHGSLMELDEADEDDDDGVAIDA